MDIYNILKEGLKGEGSSKMWCITKILSDSIEENITEKQRDALKTKIYYSINGGHFDRDFANKAISKFYYVDSSGLKHQAPYWTEDEVKTIYDEIRGEISNYNFYDFEVTLNMIKSDNCNKVNYLDDPDNPYGTEKIWKYLN